MFFSVFWSVLECFFGHQTGLKCFFLFFFSECFFWPPNRFEVVFWLFFAVFWSVFLVVFRCFLQCFGVFFWLFLGVFRCFGVFFSVFWSVLECFFGHQTGLKCFFFFFSECFFWPPNRFEVVFWLFFAVFWSVFLVVFRCF